MAGVAPNVKEKEIKAEVIQPKGVMTKSGKDSENVGWNKTQSVTSWGVNHLLPTLTIWKALGKIQIED